MVFEPKRPILKTDNKIYFIQISDVLIPVPDPNPDSDFDDLLASILILIQFGIWFDSNLEPTPQVESIPLRDKLHEANAEFRKNLNIEM